MDFVNKYVTLKSLIVLFMFIVLFEYLFSVVLGPKFLMLTNNTPLLDMTTFYTPEQAYEMIENYGAEGRVFYSYIQIVDLFFPVVYSLFFLTTLIYLLLRYNLWRKCWRYLIVIPLLAGLCDWTENVGIYIMLHRYPAIQYAIAQMTNLACIMKFGLITLSIMIIFLLLVFRRIFCKLALQNGEKR